jgi:hypothetical protein
MRILLFFFIVLLWPFFRIFVLSENLSVQKYVIQFLSYSVVGIISGGFLIFFLSRAASLRHKIYIFSGYFIVSPWVYFFFYYLNFWITPILLTIIASFVPVIGAFLGSKIGKNT